MSRPKPIVLMEQVDENTGKCEQILLATGVYIVYYGDQPINIKTFNKLFDYPGPKYRKTMFPNPAHAYNLAEQLNEKYNTDKFNVRHFE